MKKIGFIFLFFISIYSYGQQQRRYIYDDVGKRIQRTILIFRMDDMPPTVDYGVNIFPNPSSDNLNILISNLPADAVATIQIVDETGKKVFELKQSIPQEAINISRFQSGIYFLHITINSDKMIYKILKQE